MNKKFTLIGILLVHIIFTSFKEKRESIFHCYSEYKIINNSNTTITKVTILANDDLVGARSYSENVYIQPGTEYSIPTTEFLTESNTLSLKILVKTNNSFIAKNTLSLGGVLVKSNQEILASSDHGINYNISFYCTYVDFRLSN